MGSLCNSIQNTEQNSEERSLLDFSPDHATCIVVGDGGVRNLQLCTVGVFPENKLENSVSSLCGVMSHTSLVHVSLRWTECSFI